MVWFSFVFSQLTIHQYKRLNPGMDPGEAKYNVISTQSEKLLLVLSLFWLFSCGHDTFRHHECNTERRVKLILNLETTENTKENRRIYAQSLERYSTYALQLWKMGRSRDLTGTSRRTVGGNNNFKTVFTSISETEKSIFFSIFFFAKEIPHNFRTRYLEKRIRILKGEIKVYRFKCKWAYNCNKR